MPAQMSRFPVVGAGIMALLSMVGSSPAFSADATAQQQIVDKAQLTLEAFASDGQLKDVFKQLSKEARALFIIPQFMRGAFIFGGAGGSGVLIARDERTGKWGDPVFYNIGSASFGAQIGADVSEMVLVVRTKKGLEEFFTNDFKLGANAGMATGPVGGGMVQLQRISSPTPDRKAHLPAWPSMERSSLFQMIPIRRIMGNPCARPTSL